MTWIVRRAVVMGLLVTVGAAIALFFTAGVRSAVIDVYVLVVGAIVLLALIRAARALRQRTAGSAFERSVRARATPDGELDATTLEREVELSQIDAYFFHVRMRPLLHEIAAHRLRMRYGIELDRDPERARELVPAPLWDVVRPDRRPPEDRLAPGPSLSDQRSLVEELEKL